MDGWSDGEKLFLSLVILSTPVGKFNQNPSDLTPKHSGQRSVYRWSQEYHLRITNDCTHLRYAIYFDNNLGTAMLGWLKEMRLSQESHHQSLRVFGRSECLLSSVVIFTVKAPISCLCLSVCCFYTTQEAALTQSWHPLLPPHASSEQLDLWQSDQPSACHR